MFPRGHREKFLGLFIALGRLFSWLGLGTDLEVMEGTLLEGDVPQAELDGASVGHRRVWYHGRY